MGLKFGVQQKKLILIYCWNYKRKLFDWFLDSYRAHTDPIRDLNILRIEKLSQQKILLFMFKIHHYDIPRFPTKLLYLFRKNNVVYSHNTRTSNSYHISSSTSSNVMSYCIHIWNAVYNKININVSYLF